MSSWLGGLARVIARDLKRPVGVLREPTWTCFACAHDDDALKRAFNSNGPLKRFPVSDPSIIGGQNIPMAYLVGVEEDLMRQPSRKAIQLWRNWRSPKRALLQSASELDAFGSLGEDLTGHLAQWGVRCHVQWRCVVRQDGRPFRKLTDPKPSRLIMAIPRTLVTPTVLDEPAIQIHGEDPERVALALYRGGDELGPFDTSDGGVLIPNGERAITDSIPF